jgi:hypothetical protein
MALPSEMAPEDLAVFGAEQGFPPLADAEIALVRASKTLCVPAERLANFILASLDDAGSARRDVV